MPRSVDVVIIGSGFSGLGMAIRLKQSGRHDFVILEQAEDLGGTWRDNTYPGCACDVPSYLYSFSFAQNPRWSRMFSGQQEIWDYLRDCAKRYDLEPHLHYRSPVTAAVYDRASGRWDVEVDGSPAWNCRVLVAGVGALALPKTPDLPGLETFTGTTFHSAEWPANRDVTGQRVAIVGTGASGIQLVPALADKVAQLDVYQRTAAWLVPRPDRAIGQREKAFYERFPVAQRVVRDLVYWLLEVRGTGFTVSSKLMGMLERSSRRQLEKQVPDPQLRARLTPDYQIGCKRVLLSSDFYPALQKPRVELVTESIETFTPDGIRDASGVERPVDTVVFATGFDVRGNLLRMKIIGADGASLEDTWEEQGVNAHLGIMMAGFPNLFLLLGPNTGLGHTSVVFMIESQVAFVLKALDALDQSGGRQIDVRRGVQRRSVAAVQRRLRDSVWQSGCHSWYQDETGRNYTIWPRSTVRYWLTTRRIRRHDYRLAADTFPVRAEKGQP